LTRSTAFEVAGSNLSSRKVSAFSRFGLHSFLSAWRTLFSRWTFLRSAASFLRAVAVRQRLSNRR
jgi:hypothetical protein